jgi:hypothetical protein
MEKSKYTGIKISKMIAGFLNKKNQKVLVLWAIDCAEHVLPYFEEKYPQDKRPRKAIEAGRAWLRGEITTNEARTAAFAAHAAARDANHNAACAAARAAGHAAATAHVATHAEHAATYASKAAFYGTNHANDKGIIKERDWQLQYLLYLATNH